MTITDEAPVDDAAVEAFVAAMVGHYVGTAATLMIGLGHKTGLFEALADGPATSDELAARARQSERHVREWLGGVASAGIVTFDPMDRRFALPAAHAAVLTGPSAANLAGLSPLLVHLAHFVDDVAERFHTGGGVSYDRYRPGFTAAMDEANRRTYDTMLVDVLLPLAPGLVDRLEQGTVVADIGCGTGHAVNVLAQRFPTSSFVGYDFGADAIELARAEADDLGLTNARFEVADVARLEPATSFGVVFAFDAIHDQADPARVLERVHAALEPGGTFFIMDINASSDVANNVGNPFAVMAYTFSVLHCMEVSLADGGAALGAAWGRELACRMLEDAKFEDVVVHDLEHDPLEVVYTCRRR